MGVSPEARVEGRIEMGRENQRPGKLWPQLQQEGIRLDRERPHQDGSLSHGVSKGGFGVLPRGSVKTKI